MLLICVTGDIAFSGTEEQYVLAELFFDEMYEKIINICTNLDIQFVFVPGNHDCDFKDSKNTVRNTIINSDTLNMDDSDTVETCISIQKNYFDFVKGYENRKLSCSNRTNSIFTLICEVKT